MAQSRKTKERTNMQTKKGFGYGDLQSSQYKNIVKTGIVSTKRLLILNNEQCAQVLQLYEMDTDTVVQFLPIFSGFNVK